MLDVLGNPIEEGDRVLFPAGAEQMKGTVIRIREHGTMGGRAYFKAFIENESGYRKWKSSIALVKINDMEN